MDKLTLWYRINQMREESKRRIEQYNNALKKFKNPDKGLLDKINIYKSNKGKEIVDSCINVTCYVCGRGYTGRASVELCPNCISLLESPRFSHLLC